jgi:hypothetical protein
LLPLAARLFSGFVCGLIAPKTTAPKAAHVTISKEGVMKQVQYCGYTIDVSVTLEDFEVGALLRQYHGLTAAGQKNG